MSSEKKHERQVRGIGTVLTSPDAFSDADLVPRSRLSRRQTAASPAVAPPVEEPRQAPALSGSWGSSPTLPAQVARFPDSLRFGPRITAVFRYSPSDPSGLDALNELQRRAHGEAPKILILETERQFVAGEWFVCVDYSEIQYQQL